MTRVSQINRPIVGQDDSSTAAEGIEDGEEGTVESDATEEVD